MGTKRGIVGKFIGLFNVPIRKFRQMDHSRLPLRKAAGAVALSLCSRPNLGNDFPGYLDGELPAAKAAEIEEHLAVCPSCRRQLRLWLCVSLEALPSLRSKPQLNT